MPPPLLDQIVQTALPQHCEPSSAFLASLSSHLHICLPTPLALISSVLGTLSIVSWLFAQLPQIYKNFQLQSTSGLSLFFLVEWCLGDASNLVGALLTRQAGWQVIVAGYYVLVDVTLVFQYFWYTHYKQPRPTDITDVKDLKAQGLVGGQSPSYSNEKMSSSRRSVTRTGSGRSLPSTSTRTVLLASMLCAVLANAAPTEPETGSPSSGINLELIGRIVSWMSTVLYLGSRPPQLYKNYCRKSTSGLSPLLFMAAFGGNLFYSASLLTNPNAWYDFPAYGGGGWADGDGNDRLEWVGRAIPFFLGAFGVLGLDGFMGVQFLMYGSNDGESIIEVEDPKRGRSRWTRVRGWMRGWIPSVSPKREIHHSNPPTPHERRALLDEDRERYGTV
ncbi:PQ loop repeat protein [Aspergillus steynii IBT 23096]|uniref:PQ loop repeat protein n=1 Tax=Aspergillus steynii IBT 23096 TaxID=1392250 RepID=A0A2I2FST5_9EURO|nr:PQ loop repeat protein [Aspergillus steynii IBT 23096]PLB43695.1 PQ loop repeat protein [Aspergillus steynii IBT 23096]